MKARRKSFKRLIHYRYLKFLLFIKSINYALEHRKVQSLDPIQEPLYLIVLKLIHNEDSELNFDSVIYNYHVECDHYLVIIKSMDSSINLTEYKDDRTSNNFDVVFSDEHMKIIISNFNREVHKRMKNNQILRTTKISKHLRTILGDIELKNSVK